MPYPGNQDMAYGACTAGTSSYPAVPPPPAATIAAQGRAVTQWRDRSDPAGRQTAAISVPTLIADGTAGRLGPAAPDHSLARPIRGARLVPCPDAGHAFMVQEGTPFPVLIQTFPTRAPRPVSMPVMRARFLAGQAPVRPAARARDPELQALPADPAAGRPPSSASPSPAPSPPSTASS